MIRKTCLFILAWLSGALLAACAGSVPPTVDVQRAVEGTVAALLARTQVADLLATRTPAVAAASATVTPVPVPLETATSGPTGTEAVDCVPPDAPRQIGLVTGVVDGDTINVLIDGQDLRVRYIGIDAPEPGDANPNFARLGELSMQENARLVDGQIVTLVRDVSETDRFGRLLRYVFLGEIADKFANLELVRTGFAWASDYPPDVACSQVFHAAEQSAREANLGLWGPLAAAIRTEPAGLLTPEGTATPGGTAEDNCDPAYPDVCIPPPPPDLDCWQIEVCNFRVLSPDPHFFDGNGDGMGCERCPGN